MDVLFPGEARPLLEVAGIMKDHPLLDEGEPSMAEYREEVDAAPDPP